MLNELYHMNRAKNGRDLIEHTAAERGCQIMTLDGYDSAIIGVAEVGGKISACYSEWEICKILVDRDRMSPQDAEDYIDFNVSPLCGRVGQPVLVET